MIEHVRREDRLRRGVRQTRRREEKALTATGKQTRAARRPAPQVDASVLEVDRLVAGLVDWMRVPLIRAYLFGQADRNAAEDLRLPKWMYRSWRLAAEEAIGERLAKSAPASRLRTTPVDDRSSCLPGPTRFPTGKLSLK